MVSVAFDHQPNEADVLLNDVNSKPGLAKGSCDSGSESIDIGWSQPEEVQIPCVPLYVATVE